LSDIIDALLEAGLSMNPWWHFPMMVPNEEGLYRLPDGHPSLPLSFSLRASKSGRG